MISVNNYKCPAQQNHYSSFFLKLLPPQHQHIWACTQAPRAHACLLWELRLQPRQPPGSLGATCGVWVPSVLAQMSGPEKPRDPAGPWRTFSGNWKFWLCSLESMSCDLRGCGWPPWRPGVLEIKKEDLEQKTVGWQTQRGPGWGVPTARQPKLFSYSEFWRTHKQPFINSSMVLSQVQLDFSHLHPLESSLKPCTKKKIHRNIHSEYLFLMELKWFLFFLGCMARDSRSFHLSPRSFSGRRKSEKQMFF